jgi:cytochrome c oxidase assembly factor CtaG
MRNPRWNQLDWVLLVLAAPFWLFLAITVPQGTGWGGSPVRYVTAPLVLCGIAAAVRHLFRNRQHAWTLSALIAGVAATAVLLGVAWLASR